MRRPKLFSSSFNSYFSSFFPSEEDISMVCRHIDLEGEYSKALHTTSFLHLWEQAHFKPSPTITTTTTTTTTLPSLEHSQSFLLSAALSSGSCMAIFDFLDATFQSFSACIILLTAIDRSRSFHISIRRHLHRLISEASSSSDLSAHIELGNPLSSQSLALFHQAHALYPPLLTRLITKHRRLRRRATTVRAAGIAAIATVGIATVVAAVLLSHGAAVLVAAAMVPAMAAGGRRRWRGWVSAGLKGRAWRKADAAARGAYIVGRDMDTVSRMVRRVHDEVEHKRYMARMVLVSGETEMVREAMKEMELGEVAFFELIEELEEHVFLCLLTINRSRSLLAGEMAGG